MKDDLKFPYFKIFVLWLVAITLLLVKIFSLESLDKDSFLIFVSVLALPSAFVITIIQKWFFEVKMKKVLQAQGFESEVQKSQDKTPFGLLLFSSSLFLPAIVLVIPFYYIIFKTISLLVKKFTSLSTHWCVSASATTVFFSGVFFAYSVFRNLIRYLSNSHDFFPFSPEIIVMYLAPVIFYEWYGMRKNSTVQSGISVLSFILIPSAVLAGYYLFECVRSGTLNWYLLQLIQSLPTGILFASVWILIREKQKLKIMKERVGGAIMNESSTVFSSLLILSISMAVILFWSYQTGLLTY